MQRIRDLDPRLLSNLALLILALIVFALAQSGQLDWVRGLLVAPLTPVQTWLAERVDFVAELTERSPALDELAAENASLQARLSALELENIRLREIEAERDVLAAILDYARANPEPEYLPADVVAQDSSPILSFLILNRGTIDGVRRDMPVVGAEGLVGVITEVAPNLSKVLLISDPTMAVNVRLQQTRIDGVVEGQGTNSLQLRFVDVDADLVEDDILITSGLGGSYPSGIPVGTVSAITRRSFDLFQVAEITPRVDFERLEVALIITNFEPVDLDPLLATPIPEP